MTKLKKLLFTFCLTMLFSISTFAQVGIGTITPNAKFDVPATNSAAPNNTDGVLIPRMSVFPAINPTVLQNGMLVFLTTTVGTKTPGFYYWDNSVPDWIAVGNNSTTGWNLTGNAGINPISQYIGTNNAVDFRVRTGGNERFNFTSNGRLRSFDDGLPAQPTYSWNSATGLTMGMYRIGSNILGFSTNSAERFRIDANGNVGIGNAANTSAILDANATDKGLLIPRVSLTAKNSALPVTSPATSLLVYNIATAGTVPNNVIPGFYYWNSTAWVEFSTNANANDWTLLGNAGTSATTNFIGTTDNVNVVFRRNNLRAGYIGDPIYNLSTFDSNNGNTSFGANSLLNPTINVGTQTGVRNTAIGSNIMPNLTTGRRNTGLGDSALLSNTSGSENSAIGAGALFSNTISSGQVAVGRNALTSFNGSAAADIGNTAVGFSALRQTVTGVSNTAIGYETLRNVTGSGNVGIGYHAGRLETGSNKLYIENSNADATNALVYGEFDTKILRTNGQLQIGNPTGTGYVFPTTRGTDGQILQTNATGVVTWANPNATKSVVRTLLAANQNLTTTGWQKVNFNLITFDTNTEFNNVNSRFIASKAGFYQINAALHTNDQTNLQFYSIGVRVNGNFYQQTSGNHINNGPVSRTINCIVSLNVGDYVEIFVENYQSGVFIDFFSGKTSFEIQEIR